MFKNKLIKIILVVLFLVSVGFIVFEVYLSKRNEPQIQNIKTVSNAVDLSKISPGISTKTEVVNLFGRPLKKIKTSDTETLFYNSVTKTRNNQIIVTEDTVVLTKEMVLPGGIKKISDFTKLYGIAIYSFFGPDSAGGNKLYVYPDKGIAYLGNAKFDSMEEIWYFSPTTMGDFKTKWAQDYTEKQVLNLY